LKEINEVLTIVSFAIILMLEVLLIVKLKFRRLDFSAVFQLSVYLIAAVSRMILYLLSKNDSTFIQLIGVLTMLATWGLLYFMVFEMMYIRATLESESH
jgi:hypothetical protein